MELEQAREKFAAEGLGVAAISHDTPEILRHFAERMGGFSYPVLADPASEMIRGFGILNRNIEESSPTYGMARPGTFVVSADGIVTAKYFEPGHRRRTTAESILIRESGAGGGTRLEVTTDHFKLNAYPAQDEVRRGNRFTLVMDVELPEKMHLYAPGVQGYKPVVLKLEETPYLKVHEPAFPESKTLHLPAIQETVPVYEGTVRFFQDVTLSPRFEGYDKPEPEELTIPLTFAYQACDDKVCYVPTELPLTFTMSVVQHDTERVPETLRRRPSGSDP